MKELLTKIQNISQCLQDEEINFDFSNNLIKERINKLLTIIEDTNVLSFPNKEQITSYSKGEGNTIKILTLVSHLILTEEEYINTIILSSNNTSKNNVKVKIIRNIITPLIDKVILSLKDLISTQKKYDVSNITSISYDFYHHLDIMNSWIENTETIYINTLQRYHLNDMLNTITDSIQNVNEFCVYYINNYFKGISILNNEKIENENILTITSNTIYFIENIISFPSIQQRIYSLSNNNINNVSIVLNLIQALENKANVLDKKYPPLHYIFLMNNVQLIYSKIQKSEVLINEYSEEVLNEIDMKLKKYLNEYLKVSWMKVEEITFDDKDVIAYENDNKTLKQTSKDLIKQKFSVFNDAMKINLKFQQNIQIVDRDLEKRIIEANIEYIVNRYMEVFEKYGGVVFTKFKEK